MYYPLCSCYFPGQTLQRKNQLPTRQIRTFSLVVLNGYFFNSITYFTIARASSFEICGCGNMGTLPQLPEPPLITLSASLSITSSVAGAYLAATASYAGPVAFSFTL